MNGNGKTMELITQVGSMTTDGLRYDVVFDHGRGKLLCSCPAHYRNRSKDCKHLRSLLDMNRRMNEAIEVVGRRRETEKVSELKLVAGDEKRAKVA